jgi:hypothetical protein
MRRMTWGVIGILVCSGLIVAVSTPLKSTTRSTDTVQLWGLPDSANKDIRVGVANVDAATRDYRISISQGGRTISEQPIDLPAGTNRLFVVRRTALWTDAAPVEVTVSDAASTVMTRTISVWMPQ